MKNSTKIALFILGLILVFTAYYGLGLDQYLTFNYIKSQQGVIESAYESHRAAFLLTYFFVYVFVTAVSIPGAALMTLLGGAIFGLPVGFLVVSFASSIGATFAFLLARYIFRDSVQQKFGDKLKKINEGIEREGAYYLFALRLVPIFPFFVINILFGLTNFKAWRFYFVSQLGMLPGTVVYVNAGTQLAQLESPKGIISPEILISFALLGVFPLLAQRILGVIKRIKVYRSYEKPSNFDYNLLVIGGGSAGLVSAYIGATVKAKVALVEKDKMGGDCLNTGCVPSKALIRSAEIAHHVKNSQNYGVPSKLEKIQLPQVLEGVKKVISQVEPHDSIERYTGLGVECLQGEAHFLSPWEVEVNGKTIKAKNIVVATGARPFVPPIEGLKETPFHTSDTIWSLEETPKELVVLGGGPIGCELSQAFSRLGVEVTLVEANDRITQREDPDVSSFLKNHFESEGINVLTESRAEKVSYEEGRFSIELQTASGRKTIHSSHLLVAIGRKANTSSLGLEKLGIELNGNGTISHNELMQTKFPNIYVCGDVAGPYQFTHTAAHQAWFAAVNALFSPLKTFKVDYRVIPWCTFTHPQVGRVGLNETEAENKDIEYEVTTYGVDDLDRAMAEREDRGFIKVLTKKGSDKILGATVVSHQGDAILTEFILAMKHGLGLNKILSTIHPYPTMNESAKFTAGQWKMKRKPEKVLEWLEKFHAWRRG